MDKLKEYWDKYMVWFILGGIGIALLIGYVIYKSIYKAGSTSGSVKATGNILATIPNPSVGDEYTQQESMAIRTYTTFVEGDIAHWYTIHNGTQWNALSLDTDRVLLGVSEQYAADYAADNTANATGNFYNDVSAVTFLTTSDPQVVLTRLKALLGL